MRHLTVLCYYVNNSTAKLLMLFASLAKNQHDAGFSGQAAFQTLGQFVRSDQTLVS